MQTKRLIAAVFTIGLLLLTVSVAVAAPNTTLDGGGGVDETSSGHTLTAQVADTSLTGRSITSVTDPTAITSLSTGVPSTITVDEVDADGVPGWYVGVSLTGDLTGTDINGDPVTYPASNVTTNVTAGTLLATVVLPATNSVSINNYTADDTTQMTANTAENIIFDVTEQTSGTLYTGTYQSGVDFNLDLSGYSGDAATLTAPFTVTLYQ